MLTLMCFQVPLRVANPLGSPVLVLRVKIHLLLPPSLVEMQRRVPSALPSPRLTVTTSQAVLLSPAMPWDLVLVALKVCRLVVSKCLEVIQPLTPSRCR